MEYLFTKTPLFFFTQSFWRDEGFTYLMAKLPLLEIIKTTAKDFNPPLYYFLVHYWMILFGSSEISIRSISLIFFAINIYFFYLFCKNVFNIKSKIIWVYTFLFAINPFLLYYAFEGRMYSMFALLTTLSMYFFFQRKWGKYVIFSILGIYTHYFFIFVLASQFISLAITDKLYILKKLKQSEFVKSISKVGLAFLPWFIYIFPTITSKTENFWMGKLNLYQVFESFGVLLTGYENVYGFYDKDIWMLSLILIFVVLIGFVFSNKLHNRQNNDSFFPALFLWGLGFYLLIVIIGIFKPIFTPRYLIFSAVGFVFLLVYFLEKFPKLLRFVVLIILIIYSLSYNNLQVLNKRKGDVRSTVKKIRIEISDKDLIYVKNETMYFMLSYYFSEDRVFVYGKNYEDVPYYVGLALLPKDKFIQSLPTYPTKAFILVDDYNYIVQSRL